MATSITDQTPDLASPCIRKCTLDDDDICVGCFRSIDEICAWAGAGNAQRWEILELAAGRRELKPKHA
jgi:predicted Fe-S protein YdhL (DUF1289 family)